MGPMTIRYTSVMKIKLADYRLCEECGCIVPDKARETHNEWHDLLRRHREAVRLLRSMVLD